ncbi:hypothetical protein U9M48_000721 [Paspalum notatum var. saurae]|uniref:Uncharacterized protein n=1 Tax=Paspalum notatum var. saurae TaxID=547442 RepID=A0AAQ3PMZ2_PASNO
MEAPVSVSLGVVLSLPAKLERLLSPEAAAGHRLLGKAEKNKIRLLKDQLQELIDKCLMEPSEVDAATSTVRCWVKDVRELSYDVDDFVDELIHANQKKNLHGKIARLRDDLNRSRWISDETSRFMSRLEEAIQRHRMYNLADKRQIRPKPIDSDEPPIRRPLYGVNKAARLVGIDSSMEKLGEWLIGDEEPQLRVMSIVGLGGIGKTSLAKELYYKHGWRFGRRAFVRTSQKPDIRGLLTSILLQVRPHQLPNDIELGNLADTVSSYLQHKKYFIIIDDLWETSMWDILHRALPDDKCGSRVLTTTETEVVAQRCCGHRSKHILNMEPLSDEGSSELFFSRFLDLQSGKCEEFNKVLFQIIRKCGGFPLATIAVGSILSRQQGQVEYYNFIIRSLSSSLRTSPTVEGMKQVLSLCYENLPDHLKACMLYFSIYKEGNIIRKDDLLNQWIAEGFICVKEGKHVEEVAGSYFDELIYGGMIQPVDISFNGEVLSCTVHYMILNLIRYRSIQENFVTAIDHCQTNTRLADKVRRLSLLFGNVDDAESPSKLRLSHVRSLAFFGFFKALPSLVEFRLLRVLILHLWGDQDNISLDLTTVCKFFRLRNLKIACNFTLNLQIQLQGLEYLETLKIDSRLSEVPQDIVLLPRLLHLSLPGDLSLPNNIGRMASLRTFGCFDLTSNTADNVQSLGKLNNVHDLHLTCSTIPCYTLEENVGCLASVLSKLTNLKTLKLSPRVSNANTSRNKILFDGLSSVFSPPTLLENFDFSPWISIFSRLPRWLYDLDKLAVLKIAVRELWQNDINILHRLSYLSAFSLYVTNAPGERIAFYKEGFTVVNYFKFICSAPCLAFKKGAMPNVRRLKLGFSANALEQCRPVDAGLENLTSLEVFTANVGDADSDESIRKAVQSELENTFSECRSRPIINVRLVNKAFYGDKEMSTVVHTALGQTLENRDVMTKRQPEEHNIIVDTGSTENNRTQGECSRNHLPTQTGF